MFKKIAALLITTPLLFLAIYHYAFADSIFTDECHARILARQSLKDTYGLNLNLQAYFEEMLTSSDDGYTILFYSGNDDLDYVLGRYTVEVRGTDAKASWSWDNKEVPFAGHGLASNACGKDQLDEIWLINKQTSNMQNYGLIARGIAIAAGLPAEGYISEFPDTDDIEDYPELADYDPSKAKLSVDESKAIALNALKEAYGISDERIAAIRFDEDSLDYYGNANGEPIMTLFLLLWDDHDWQEYNGNYYVQINQATGLVEDISYIDGIIGNG